MTGAERFLNMSSRELRLELDELYAEYVGALDEERFEDWIDFFTDDCLYRIVPRENFARGLPIATLHCEGRGYLRDRVVAVRNTSSYGPRYYRRLISNIRVVGLNEEFVESRVHYAAFETLQDQTTHVLSVGEQRDKVAQVDGKLKFREKLVVFDFELIPNSLIFPL